MTAAALICADCGAELRQDNKFCHQCGARITLSPERAEYKQVTVLFADAVRSMDIAAALDMERLREIMTELVERSAAVGRRYGGTVEYTGDGVMAIFGAPVALEDHAFRACMAALAIQQETSGLAAEVDRHDGVALQVRVGLSSGRVIAGDIGSGSLGYAATGEHVGMAQRMESVAPPGGVMLSESTAQLVEHIAVLAEPEWMHIKGADEPVPARRLLGIGPRDGRVGRAEATLVGRRWEMAALDAILDRATGGRGGVVNVVGPPGIGKSRVAREAAALAARRGVKVFWVFCESHARDVPFHAVTRLLRAGRGIADVDDGVTARARLRYGLPAAADPQDLLLLDNLLGIADPDVPLPQIDADARRRRLTALINTAALSRTQPALFIVEDAHWIDAVSESMLADLLTVIPRTPSMVLITSRPEYEGALTRVHGAHAIALAPLSDSDITLLLGELLGSDSSVGELAAIIAGRAAGNPFFTEEMVRELVQRGVLTGERGGYTCRADVAVVNVPATVQATIGARIDRLNSAAKRTVHAASVIGARFGAQLLAALETDTALDELLAAELIDQVRFAPHVEYAFRHPLIRAIAYESQLKSDRAGLHRRLAAAIESGSPASADENAALIAEHLQAAGELRAACGWHIRAGAWSANRDIAAARVSWERARQIADQLPGDDPDCTAMRIAARTVLCVTAWRAHPDSPGGFEEMRELCNAAGDKASLAIGITGLAFKLLWLGRAREASRLASDQMTLLDSIGDPTLTIGLAWAAMAIKHDAGEIADVLRLSQTVIDLAEGDPAKGGNLGVGSPLAVALVWRGVGRWWVGCPGWHQDLKDAVAMARRSDPATHAMVITWKFGYGIPYGVLLADDSAVCEIEEAQRSAEGLSDDDALGMVKLTLGFAGVHRDAAADRQRGLELLTEVRDLWLRERSFLHLLPIVDGYAARGRARQGDRDGAIPVMRKAVDDLYQAGRPAYALWGTGFLVETLLDRGAEGDVAEAAEAILRLANLQGTEGWAILEITLLRLRALLSKAHSDEIAYRDLVNRYRAMAESLGFEGHIAMAKAM